MKKRASLLKMSDFVARYYESMSDFSQEPNPCELAFNKVNAEFAAEFGAVRFKTYAYFRLVLYRMRVKSAVNDNKSAENQ